jgi:hypothetical protein
MPVFCLMLDAIDAVLVVRLKYDTQDESWQIN